MQVELATCGLDVVSAAGRLRARHGPYALDMALLGDDRYAVGKGETGRMGIETFRSATGVTGDPSRSCSLPAWAYLDADVYEREKRQLFFRTWSYAGWAGELRKPGDYLTAELLDQSVIVMRGQDGALRGF